ncbi:hypothetical protein WH50_09075 [Pokkaliibacter plantistimulans]|uniref:Phosphodiesterase n=1 Tax=Pokkaliibacter plantistimulans TaxID=1635171 RepID=A0ABX5LZ38_9GAMM|nr:DUF3369 domain-containing protein [Pokkaliibacter plantistimulans]PXF31576.1 hypothetical protein WH50_09075 [Pokkaliibacter plantistimulans]
MSDDLFAPERAEEGPGRQPWYVLIVDDEAEVHRITRLALQDFQFDGRGLNFISAYTGTEARLLLNNRHQEIAVALLDVVMESDDAGLTLVDFIRNDLDNQHMRLVLRTGQPGQAPEHRVIVNYDINDYKAKTELTAQKLSTLMHTSLRGYRDIMTIEANRRGLTQVIQASADIFQRQSLIPLLDGVIEQLIALVKMDKGLLLERRRHFAARTEGLDLQVLVASDGYNHLSGMSTDDILAPAERGLIREAIARNHHIFTDEGAVLLCCNNFERSLVLFLEGGKPIDQMDRHLLDLFIHNVAIAFDNVRLNSEVEETQREIVYLLGETVETRSHETGNHVKRVAEFCYLLATLSGMSEEEASILRYAAPLHDLGKIGIPDHILHKPGRHNHEEREIMQTHAFLGHSLLSQSQRPILHAAAIIAHEHHEKWDGSGYPVGKQGEDIHIFGRIVALADVFDALCSERCYKPAWSTADALAFIQEQSGKHFDPALVQVFMANIDDFLRIRAAYGD